METTDLCEVKKTAKSLLMFDVSKTEYSPVIVQHPFTSTGITMIQGVNRILDITANEQDLKLWREFMCGQIDRAKSAYDVYLKVNKPYGLTFLKFIREYLSTKDLSLILADAWIRSENPNMDANVTKSDLVEMFQQSDKDILMSDDERRLLESFGETVTVHRGVTSYNAKNVKALSWTTDKERAEWFAHRFGECGTVYRAQIRKRNILAFFIGRNESEIVLNPSGLEQIIKEG